jgi:HSP20 family protein
MLLAPRDEKASAMSDNPKLTPEDLVKGLFQSMQTVLKAAHDVALTGADQVRKGVFPRGTGISGVYGVTFKADLGRPSLTIEPFGNLQPDASGQPVVQDWTEPRTEFADESENYVVVAEVPGVAAEDVKFDVTGQVFTFTAERGGRKYRKEITLPDNAASACVLHTCHDGLLEVRIGKKAT